MPQYPTFYFHNQKVLIVKPELVKHTSSISRKDLVSCGSIIGKFTKTKKFHLIITAVCLSQYALHKVWIKNSAEMNYLYGNDALKSHILKMSDECKVNKYCFVYNQSDFCLGFGVLSKGKDDLETCDGNTVVVKRMTDCGEYLREQDIMFE
ncbi:ribosome biosynthesis protein nip7 [Binucleata daphniae]